MRWGEFVDEHGITIRYRVWEAASPRAVVVLLHGVGEHSGRYEATAQAFVAAGYEVWADDHRGHGETGRLQYHGDLSKIGQLGPGGLRATIAAVQQFIDIAHAAHPTLPLVLLGHSWGSLMAQIIVNRRPELFAAVVLTGTAYRSLRHMDSGDLNRKHRHLGTTGAEWLSRDPAVAAAFVADELTTLTSLKKLFGLLDASRLLGKPAKNLPHTLPILIVVGSDDTLGGEPSAHRLADAYIQRSGLSDVQLIVYTGARHEVLNETNQIEVRHDILNWLNDRV